MKITSNHFFICFSIFEIVHLLHTYFRNEVDRLVQEYLKALQWILTYYYKGCCSWSWYFPYHYAPLISDIKELKDIEIKFDLSEPYLPLMHLLAILPSANNQLLPAPLRYLSTNSNSPIIQFYPKDFELDLNGKTNDWESVVLIPFIDDELIKKGNTSFNSFMSEIKGA